MIVVKTILFIYYSYGWVITGILIIDYIIHGIYGDECVYAVYNLLDSINILSNIVLDNI